MSDPRLSFRGGLILRSADLWWQTDGRDPAGIDEVICHNDLAPWNLIAGDQEWVFIDWDLAAPGRRLWDLALGACGCVPCWHDRIADWRRYGLFRDAYGLSAAQQRELLLVMVERTTRMWQVLIEHRDVEPYASLIRDGHAQFWQAVAQHIAKQEP